LQEATNQKNEKMSERELKSGQQISPTWPQGGEQVLTSEFEPEQKILGEKETQETTTDTARTGGARP